MSPNTFVWPTGISDQDPAPRVRPLVFNHRASSSPYSTTPNTQSVPASR